MNFFKDVEKTLGGIGKSIGSDLGKTAGSAIGGLIGGKKGAKEGAKIGGGFGGKIGGTAGKLAPAVMAFKKGGKVPKTGLAQVHKGEYVLPAGVAPTKAQMAKVAKGKKMAKGKKGKMPMGNMFV